MVKECHRTRHVSGVLLLDKPPGITSSAALQKVKHLYNASKAGHTGSLDPLATGMLPICLGEATKFSRFLLNANKRYHVAAKLGIKTNTGDAEGKCIKERKVTVSLEKIEKALLQFCGEIEQIPSMFSAIKHQGKPLYELARQGIEIERPARRITIHELRLLAYREKEQILDLEIHCSKGTYIRTLVDDLGEVLGCGAHVVNLRRLSVAHYEDKQTHTLEELGALLNKGGYESIDAIILPTATVVANWPIVRVSDAAAYYIKQGQPVIIPRAPAVGWVQLFLNGESFLGVGEILENGTIAPRRLLQG